MTWVERDYAPPPDPFADTPGIVASETTDTSRKAGANPVKKGSARRRVFHFFVTHPGSCVTDLEEAHLMPHGTVHGRVNELLGKNERFGGEALLEYGPIKITSSGKEAHTLACTEAGRAMVERILRGEA